MTRHTQMGYKKSEKSLESTSWEDLKPKESGKVVKKPQSTEGTKIKKKRTSEDVRATELKRMWKLTKRSEKRRQFRADDRDNKMVCFNCRKTGHAVSECPETNKAQSGDSKGSVIHATGICYKCGSTEHRSGWCTAKVPEGKFPFASCFICKETGHISKNCPDNPRGLYPNGGCCKHCGSVVHFVKDCPELAEERGIPNIRLHTTASSKMTSADADDYFSMADNDEKSGGAPTSNPDVKIVKKVKKVKAKKVVKG